MRSGTELPPTAAFFIAAKMQHPLQQAGRRVGRLSTLALTPATRDLLSVSKQVVIKTSLHYVRNYFWPSACSETLHIRAKLGKWPAGSVWDTLSVMNKRKEIHRP